MTKQNRPNVRVPNFEKTVKEIVVEKQVTYVEAVLIYCQENSIDPDYTKNLMTDEIKDRLEEEFGGLNMIDDSK